MHIIKSLDIFQSAKRKIHPINIKGGLVSGKTTCHWIVLNIIFWAHLIPLLSGPACDSPALLQVDIGHQLQPQLKPVFTWDVQYITKPVWSLIRKFNCHSPTQPQHELELDLIMGRNPPHPTGTIKALPGNLGS